ncbi:5-methylcytosine restriction system specificity protein McrC [Paratractidigestivibacter sp.]|uniref:5-methylcytosine restriction system specificity protein McrC n=1 Tax=Paratractidigestivibacter sp. TaxID=2847316 RepID=UPI002ABD1ED3|nr:hypothetical protein [Paratractidigestivibacter sp.]
MRAEDTVVIRNIFTMLAYAYRALDLRGFEEVGAEDFDSVLDLLGAVYAKGLASQVRRGIDQGYVELTEDLGCARGRIDVRASSGARLRQGLRLRCTYSEMSRDTELNRLIKCVGLMFLRSSELAAKTKADVRRLLPYLGDVALVEPAQARRIRPAYTRVNRSYQLLVAICRFALAGLLPDKSGEGEGFAKVVDGQQLSHLYEKFLLEYYRRHHANEVGAAAKRIDWNTDDALPVFLPGMNTDVTLTGKGERKGRTLIIDAKCYGQILTSHHGKSMVSPDNVYQLSTYVNNADVARDGSVSGMLLYALTDERDLPFRPGERGWMSGPNRFEVRTVDLGRPFDEVAAQLDDVIGFM